jgi:hypothetical protein
LIGEIPAGEIVLGKIDLAEITLLITGRRIELGRRQSTAGGLGEVHAANSGVRKIDVRDCRVNEAGVRQILIVQFPAAAIRGAEDDAVEPALLVASRGIELSGGHRRGKLHPLNNCLGEVGALNVAAGENRVGEISAGKIGVSQLRASEIGLGQIDAGKIDAGEIVVAERGRREVALLIASRGIELGERQLRGNRFIEIGSSDVGPGQIGSSERGRSARMPCEGRLPTSRPDSSRTAET